MTLLLVNDAIIEMEAMKSGISWDLYGIDNVFTAYSADDARTIISNHSIDIMLCYIEMPGENGLSLIKWIRDRNYYVDCILLSCHADFAYAKDAIALNCQEYLLLPAKYEDIGNAVLKACRLRSQKISEKRYQIYGTSWLKEQSDTLKAAADNLPKSPKEIFDDCVHFILENISNDQLSVADIASHFSLNPIYLNRIFKKECGISIIQWIIKERMELASNLLKESGQSAVIIAGMVGYSNYPYFSTAFKKHFDCTPSQYARKSNEESDSI